MKHMKSFLATKVHYHENERDSDGNLKTYITSEEAFNKATKKATESKEPLPEMIVSQTGQYSIAETVGEALKLSGVTADVSPIDDYIRDNNINVDVFLSTFNDQAAILKQHNEFADLLRESTSPREGAIDLAYAVAQKSERAKMTPEEKAAKTLGISPDQLRAALATIQAAQSAEA
jgi:hypothetical protein